MGGIRVNVISVKALPIKLYELKGNKDDGVKCVLLYIRALTLVVNGVFDFDGTKSQCPECHR